GCTPLDIHGGRRIITPSQKNLIRFFRSRKIRVPNGSDHVGLSRTATNGGEKTLTFQFPRYFSQGKSAPVMIGKSPCFHGFEMLLFGKYRGNPQFFPLVQSAYTDKINRAVLIKTVDAEVHPAGPEILLPYLVHR